MSDLVERYFEWLYGHFGKISDQDPSLTHWLLAEQLFHTNYRWTVHNDDNREMDGLSLRDDFCDLVGSWNDNPFVFRPCSVLEVLVALAIRADYEADGLNIVEGVDEWFWLFLKNIGLDGFNDKTYSNFQRATKQRVENRVNLVLDRNYGPDGHGGLFPLNQAMTDQRDVELWYQLSAYILENSDIGS